jgi:ATP-dependent DNA helicase PIF1
MLVLNDPTHEEVLSLIGKKKHLFITGPGGVGKSTLVRRIANEVIDVAVTAMTGCAALLLDCKASTLHSWAGIGRGQDSLERTVDYIKKKSYVKKRWARVQTLVIDEVSMMSPDLFEFLDQVARAVRKRPAVPFGGIQLVLVGDFCQLPPVNKDISGQEIELQFVFESPLWDELITTVVVLNKIWRQTDPVYQKVLNEARMGRLTPESEEILRGRMNTAWQTEAIKPTLLFSLNNDVDRVNVANLNALEGESQKFVAKTVFDVSRWRAANGGQPLPDKNGDLIRFAIEKLDKDAPYLPMVELRVGAQVMLLTNQDMAAGRVNGSRGVLVAFDGIRGFPIVKFRMGPPCMIEPTIWWSYEVPIVGREQIPLKIAYAITIHKSQGASIDTALVDIGKSTFEYGQAYTALSRVRSIEGLHLHAFDVRRIRTHPRVLQFYRTLNKLASEPPPEPDTTTPVSDAVAAAVPVATAVPVAAAEPVLREGVKPWYLECVHPSWLPTLQAALAARPDLESFVSSARANSTVFPAAEEVFTALRLPMSKVKVVILGQDPYHGPGQAMGLSFSVPDGVMSPPSLKNIMKELNSDLGVKCSMGNLMPWFTQGVLLLNTVLTVEAAKPASHAGKGWEHVTDALLKALVEKRKGIVFMLWGKHAQKKAGMLGLDQHILQAPHPSPLSAHTGFFGSKHFSKANELLGERSIRWAEENKE